jgi:hypothetical protein
MDRDGILERLDMLVQLCKDTEPDIDTLPLVKINELLMNLAIIEDLKSLKTTANYKASETNDAIDKNIVKIKKSMMTQLF